jgi:5'-3' exonuclease
MGIKSNFNKFISYTASFNVFEEIHVSQYATKKIAIDTTLFLFKYKASLSDKWMTGFVNLICLFRKYNVHCIFIFDGPSPEEKQSEQLHRKEGKQKLQDNVTCLEADLMAFYSTGVLSDKLQKLSSPHETLEYSIHKKKNQIVNIDSSDFLLLKEMLDILKVPHHDAITESEKFCSKLCIDGLVDAVLSDDTDVIAYCSPIALSKLNVYTGVCVSVSNEKLLDSLSIDSKQLLDFCIMCGTDYNKNIPNVGSTTAYKYIKEYKNIENIFTSLNLDISVLNHVRVRELFTCFDGETNLNYVPYCGVPNLQVVSNFFKLHDIHVSMYKLKESFIDNQMIFV